MAKKIHCKWERDKRLLVNPDGQVFPCCYLSNNYYQSTVYSDTGKYEDLPDGHKANIEHPLMKEYHENRENFNIFRCSLESIVNSKWFTETLPESWNDEKSVHFQCKRMCEVDE